MMKNEDPISQSRRKGNEAGYMPNRNGDPTPSLAPRLWGGLLTFLAILAYCLIWIWQGLDITDEGFNLTNHLLIANDSPHYVYGMIWFSDLVGGLWLMLIGDPGLIGARVGWAVAMATTGLVTYWVLTAYFSPLPVSLAIMGTAIAVNYRGIMVISYKCLPALILVAACGMILASQHNGKTTRRRVISAVGGGTLLGLGVMSKFPLVLALAFPLVPVLAQWWCLRRRDVPSLLVAVASLLSSAATILICLAWLHANGRLGQYIYFTLSMTELDEMYSLKSLLRFYARDAIEMIEHVAALAFVFSALAVVVHAGASRYRMQKVAPLLFFLLMSALAVCATLLVLGPDQALEMFSLALPGAALGLGVFCLLVRYHWVSHGRQSVHLLSLLALGLCVPLVVMAGSDNGLLEMQHGLWLILPSGLILFSESLEAATAKVTRMTIHREFVRPYLVGIVMVFVLFIISARFLSPYRDLPNRLLLTTELQHSRLKYIHTSSERAASVEELLLEIDVRVQQGDNLLAYNSIPMIHYLTQTNPAIDWPWPNIVSESFLKARLDELGTVGPLPSLVVRAKTEPRDRAWGFGGTRAPWSRGRRQVALIDRAVLRYGYEEVWFNRDFVIMTRPEQRDLSWQDQISK